MKAFSLQTIHHTLSRSPFLQALFVKALKRERAVRNPKVRGLPEGLSSNVFYNLVQNIYGFIPDAISYQHLTEWRQYGAYRIWFQAGNQKEFTLIYKHTFYDLAAQRARSGCGFIAGPPEFLIYSHYNKTYAQYLPVIYFSSSPEPGVNYHFLLEDLSVKYQAAFKKKDILLAAAALPAFHAALSEWFAKIKGDGFIHYDFSYSANFREYAGSTLTRFTEATGNKAAASFCQLWPQIKEFHASNDFRACLPIRPIHGDVTGSNILINKRDPEDVKFIDWELAGYGLELYDLASLLKNSDEDIEKEALKIYNERAQMLPLQDLEKVYFYCKLERLIFDSAFTAAYILSLRGKKALHFVPILEEMIATILHDYQKCTLRNYC